LLDVGGNLLGCHVASLDAAQAGTDVLLDEALNDFRLARLWRR
jgi:hypothetical protein